MAASDSSNAQEREPVRFLVFSASLRADSLNSRLARLAAATIEANGGIVDPTAMPDFETPSYDADDGLLGRHVGIHHVCGECL